MTQVIFKTRRIKPTPIATEENQAMTIPTPIKESNPELYTRHVKHFTKAKAFTYNYYPQDEVILENYSTMTIKEIAHMLNEYVERITYRVRVLRTLGILKSKRTRRTKVELALATLNDKKEFHQVELRQVRRQLKELAA